VAWWFARPAFSASIIVGRADDFSPGSVTALRLPAGFDDPLRPHNRWALNLAPGADAPAQFLVAFRSALRQPLTPAIGWVTAIPLFVVRSSDGEVIALYNRDPLTGCGLDWRAAEQRFEDQCSYSSYSATGAYLRGPARRDMDRFAVALTNAGELAVDVSSYQPGVFHR
jgi:hypothetical protein